MPEETFEPDWYLNDFDDPDTDPDVQRFLETLDADHE
jgi:hypothetical protein